MAYLSRFARVDLSGYDFDGPIPDLHIQHSDETNPNIRANLIKSIVERNGLKTLRQLYSHIAGGRGHLQIVGSPQQVADRLQEWFENEAADGFNIMAPTFPQGLQDIVDLLIPELQSRGLFKEEYTGTTLRENLGLKRLENPYLQQKITRSA